MGLGYSVESLGTQLTGDSRIVTEGLAIAIAYMAIRYVHISITKGDVAGGNGGGN